jgi:hypothetical protein
MDNFHWFYLNRTHLLMTLILMGDWCSEDCNRKPKEISAKVEMLVAGSWNLARK